MLLPVFPDNTTQILEGYKGALGSDLSAVNIVLSVAILLQNPLIISCYRSQRANFSAAMYIAIAIADMVLAQGAIVISVVGIAVTSEKWDIRVLYYCFYYLLATSGLAQNCSKYYNAVLSVVTTMKLQNPFRIMNIRTIKMGVAVLTLGLSLFCLLDGSACLFLELSGNFMHVKDFHKYFYLASDFPGVASLYVLLCEGFDSHLCYHDQQNYLIRAVSAFVLVFLNLILPPLIFLISGLWLLILLRRATREHDDSNNLHSAVRHISVTVFCIASLSFLCNTALALVILYGFTRFELEDKRNFYNFFKMGRIIGIATLTLPLTNSALFSAILISRSSSLKQKLANILMEVVDFPKILFEKLHRSIRGDDDETSDPYF